MERWKDGEMEGGERGRERFKNPTPILLKVKHYLQGSTKVKHYLQVSTKVKHYQRVSTKVRHYLGVSIEVKGQILPEGFNKGLSRGPSGHDVTCKHSKDLKQKEL